MIDENAFSQEMELLCERFNRVPSEPVIMRYFTFLEARLTTEQFQESAITIFNEDQFWPSPQRFVDLIHGSLEDQAAVEWSKLMAAYLDDARAEDVSPMARKVWSETYAAGQLNADGGDQRASFVRRDFIQTYRAYITIGDKPPGLLRAITPAENANMFEVATRVQTVLAKRTAATEVAPEQITPVRAAELAAEFRSKRRSAQH